MSARLLAGLSMVGAFAACGADDAVPARVLVFSGTTGFRHEDSIAAGRVALSERLAAEGIAVEATEDPLRFRARELAAFGAVVFLNTTGNDLLDADGQAALEAFVRGGRGWVGVHSAADTEYDWPFYAELVVTHFRSHPAIQPATVHVEDATHPATAGAPSPWMATDEWYDFRTNPRDTADVRILLTIDESTYTGGVTGADHALAWAHERAGGRAFYTALGHVAARWDEPAYLDHVAGGIRWTLRRD
ncbi:MAG: ThuA domain-containing protein [Kofleriaceae bacterium]|nr:MAG: ThuA domain-containing protein [Kofleriaceae bacterium]MBZ0231952.1 ThuA domain-containing protein [Kofleriaceae bacterium]